MDALIGALGDFSDLGRHEDFSSVDVMREDALAVLRMTLSIFE